MDIYTYALSRYRKTSNMYAMLTQEEFFTITSSFSTSDIQRSTEGLHIFKTTSGISGIFSLHQQCNKREYYTICFIPAGKEMPGTQDSEPESCGQLFFLSPTAKPEKVFTEVEEIYCCTFKATSILPKISDHFYRLPMFSGSTGKWLQLDKDQRTDIHTIFDRMLSEISSSYQYKHNLLLTYLFELIHYALRIQRPAAKQPGRSSNNRITADFIELLESQFPIERKEQRCKLRFARDFSKQLCVHVNHLNRAIRETTGKTTSQLISDRIASEARHLLYYTDWSISDIGYSLGFDEPSNFNSFFRKHTALSPSYYRQHAASDTLNHIQHDVV